eukprot:TRINITY_DN44675_c0_g1_i1.p1 TRINITY_DN44675_c0_g1~~TRINITY_DN44675_c0_g1_i1.p1  ORF type:complete len:252 (+),score=20.91 TRINITY_DN44675_c0_g1_i1:73-756(+)
MEPMRDAVAAGIFEAAMLARRNAPFGGAGLMLGGLLLAGLVSEGCGNAVISLLVGIMDGGGGGVGLVKMATSVMAQVVVVYSVLQMTPDEYIYPETTECYPHSGPGHDPVTTFVKEALSTAVAVACIGIQFRRGLRSPLLVPFSLTLASLLWNYPCMNPAVAIAYFLFAHWNPIALQTFVMGPITGATLCMLFVLKLKTGRKATQAATPQQTVSNTRRKPAGRRTKK